MAEDRRRKRFDVESRQLQNMVAVGEWKNALNRGSGAI
jgi:hypothetical protein